MMFDIPFGDEQLDLACSSVPFMAIYLRGRVRDGEHDFVVVDQEDFVWASQWRWQVKRSKNGRKIYAFRSTTLNGRNTSVYLHKEVCFRAHGRPPSRSHIIADHKDGASQNCRRGNLRWATPSENRRNYAGLYAIQLRMAFLEGNDDRLQRFQQRRDGRGRIDGLPFGA